MTNFASDETGLLKVSGDTESASNQSARLVRRKLKVITGDLLINVLFGSFLYWPN